MHGTSSNHSDYSLLSSLAPTLVVDFVYFLILRVVLSVFVFCRDLSDAPVRFVDILPLRKPLPIHTKLLC